MCVCFAREKLSLLEEKSNLLCYSYSGISRAPSSHKAVMLRCWTLHGAHLPSGRTEARWKRKWGGCVGEDRAGVFIYCSSLV